VFDSNGTYLGGHAQEEMPGKSDMRRLRHVGLQSIRKTQQEVGQSEADRRHATINQLDVEVIVEVREPVLLIAARFKASHRLSFADTLIAAYSLRHDATPVQKDPEYETLAGVFDMEDLPYKTVTS
jgi:predicted nucleic acid-binding protein